MVQYDLPSAYNVVGDDPDALPAIAAAAGLQVVEIPDDMLLQAVIAAWKEGKRAGSEEMV